MNYLGFFWHPNTLHRLFSPSAVVACFLADFVYFLTMADKAPKFSSFLSGTPMITVNRLKGSDNYQSWTNSITLWFTGNGVEDHLTSTEPRVVADKLPQCQKHDALLSNILQQSIDPKTLDNLGDY